MNRCPKTPKWSHILTYQQNQNRAVNTLHLTCLNVFSRFLPSRCFSPCALNCVFYQAVTKSHQITLGAFASSPTGYSLLLLSSLSSPVHAHTQTALCSVSSASQKRWWRANTKHPALRRWKAAKPFNETRRHRRWLLRLHIVLLKESAHQRQQIGKVECGKW